MSAPWEKFAGSSGEPGPWAKYAAPAAPAAPATAPSAADIPGATDEQKRFRGGEPIETPGKQTLGQRAVGAGEAALSALTAPVGQLAGGGAALLNRAAGNVGTGPGQESFQSIYDRVSRGATYEPRTPAGREALGAVGRVADQLPPVLPEMASLRGLGGRPMALRGGTQDLRDAAAGLRDGIRRPPPEMAGGGAASTAAEAQRRAEAAGLDVPVPITKAQATRDFGRHREESELAKREEGEPLRQMKADQNEAVLKNFDAWVDNLGAEAPDLRAAGKVVDSALVKRTKAAKAEIRAAYDEAKASGAMEQPVSARPLVEFLAQHHAEAINAPILNSVAQKLAGIAKNGQITINDSEELRKMVNNLAQPGTPNLVYGKQVKELIDQMTEGAGGELYKRARKLRADYAREFEDHAIVDKLLRTKPGTADRAVAFEDVFKHSILDGSHDDVAVMRKVIEAAGDEGKAAWRELQGATIQHIRDQAIKNVQRDVRGNPIPSPAALVKAVRELDRDGKLELVFDKQQAAKIRDLTKVVLDSYTAPPGSVNYVNTASVLLGALRKLSSITARLPTPLKPLGYVADKGAQIVESGQARKKVAEAIAQPQIAPPPAGTP